MAVARELQRKQDAESGRPVARRDRKSKRLRLVGVFLVFVCGLSIGALPFLIDLSWDSPRGMSFEQVLGTVQDSRTSQDRVGTLLTWLSASAARGIKAIRAANTSESTLRTRLTHAVSRIRTVLATGEPDRTNAPRYPTWLGFEAAIVELRRTPLVGQRAYDAVEATVYNIEEAVRLFKVYETKPGTLGAQARASRLKVQFTLDR